MHNINWTYGLSIAFALLWLFCVIHCLRNKKIYRLLGFPPTLVKVCWILLFLTFSPFALLAYLLMGILIRQKEVHSIFTHLFCTCLFFFVFYISLPSFWTAPLEPARWIRTPSGWQNQQFKTEKSPFDVEGDRLKFHAGLITSHFNTSTTSSVSAGSHAVMPFQHLAVQLETNHPLVSECALVLVESLKKNPEIESIVLIPYEGEFAPGQRLPDSWITLDISKHSEIFLPPTLKMDSEFEMTLSSEPYHSIHSYHETYSLPRVSYNLDCEIIYQSQSTVIYSHSAKYEQAAPHIVKEMNAAIQNFLKANRPKYPDCPNELENLIADRKDFVEPPLQIMRRVKPKIEGRLPLAKSIAYWEIPLGNDIHETFDALEKEIEGTDWRVQDRYGEKENPYMRLAKDYNRIVLFAPKGSPGDWDQPLKNYIIQFEQRIPPEEIKSQLKEIVENGCSTHFLLMMHDWFWMDSDMQSVYLNALEQSHDRRPEILLQKAYLYGTLKRFTKQRRALHEAQAAEQIYGSDPSRKSAIENELKKFQKNHPEYVSPISWKDIFESLGAQPLSLEDKTVITQKVQLHEAIAFYYFDEKGAPQIASAFMAENGKDHDSSPYTLHLRCCSQRGGSTEMTSGSPQQGAQEQYEWKGGLTSNQITFSAQCRSMDEDAFELTLTVRPQNE
ncbi:MAG: PspC domain-containing protein [Candidatus Omnitrophica bacterium]|nr:PspC domain-containing protein [Candidatus Omnitrophota bacterium]